jgi:hypothetical protein
VTAHGAPAVEQAAPIRRLLLAVVLLGMCGLALELFLLEHTESAWQWVPFAVLAAGLASGGAVAVRPTRAALHAFQAVMAIAVGAGLLGLYLHYTGNAEFELESDPSLRGLRLFWTSVRGATPVLAPGALAQLGLLGLVHTFRHPGLRRPARAGTHPQEIP